VLNASMARPSRGVASGSVGPPRVSIRRIDVAAGETADQWRVGWFVQNEAPDLLLVTGAWVPHGRFRGPGRVPLHLQVPAGAAVLVELGVRAREPPGTAVDNAFLILEARYCGLPWRIFARMRIEFDTRPRPRCELVTTQAIQSAACR
jgi:hypothetical protein